MEDQNITPPTPPTPPEQEPTVDDIPPLKPNNWLWQSIVATLFFCVPLGIVGIVYAARVDTLYYNRKYAEAKKTAKNAKTWTLIAVAVGLISLIIWGSLFSTSNLSSAIENIIEDNASGYNF